MSRRSGARSPHISKNSLIYSGDKLRESAPAILHHLPAPSSIPRDSDWRLPPPPVVPVSEFHPDIVLWPAPSLPVRLPAPFAGSSVSTPLMAPPKACRSRSPDADHSRSRDRPVHAVWDVSSNFPEKIIGGSIRSSHSSPSVAGYSQFHLQETGDNPSAARDPLRHRRVSDVDSTVGVLDSEPVMQTRASSRRTEIENAPIAKRLRH